VVALAECSLVVVLKVPMHHLIPHGQPFMVVIRQRLMTFEGFVGMVQANATKPSNIEGKLCFPSIFKTIRFSEINNTIKFKQNEKEIYIF